MAEVWEQINEYIKSYGSERDALNVALARLQAALETVEMFREMHAETYTLAADLADEYMPHGTRGYFGVNPRERALAQRVNKILSTKP